MLSPQSRPVAASNTVGGPDEAETRRRENDAHVATVEAFSSLTGVVGDDDVVDAAEGETMARRYAAAHLLADLWRVLVNLPMTQAKHMEALVTALAGRAG